MENVSGGAAHPGVPLATDSKGLPGGLCRARPSPAAHPPVPGPRSHRAPFEDPEEGAVPSRLGEPVRRPFARRREAEDRGLMAGVSPHLP